MKIIIKMKASRVKPRLQPEAIETLRHRGGAHGKRSGKKTYDRQNTLWRKEY